MITIGELKKKLSERINSAQLRCRVDGDYIILETLRGNHIHLFEKDF